MKLNDTERNSAPWQKVKAELESRLDLFRRKNDSNLDAEQTAKLRGRIAEIKNLLALGEPPPPEANDR